MIASLMSGLRRARLALVAVAATLLMALIVTPAHAAAGLADLESGTIAVVVVLGTLAFALAYEIMHLTSRHASDRRDTRTH
ncbi:MAG: hypothetical protein KKH72_07250 [Alphaproteobacteria bacterium]|nr:hypothetical protein [Alphaproteobacteria bacterium]